MGAISRTVGDQLAHVSDFPNDGRYLGTTRAYFVVNDLLTTEAGDS